jgi:hypothetical protein
VVKHHWRCFCPTKRIVRGAWFCELTTSCTSCRPVRRQSPEPDPICGDAVTDLLPLLASAPPAQTASVNEAQTAQECWEQGGMSFTEDLVQGTPTCYIPLAIGAYPVAPRGKSAS